MAAQGFYTDPVAVKKQKSPTPDAGMNSPDNLKRRSNYERAHSIEQNQRLGSDIPIGYDDSFLKRARDLNYQFGREGSAGAEIRALQARSAQLRGLNAAESSLPGMVANERNELERTASSTLDTGIKNTRKNYSNRGLLYGGLREGGEQDLRGQVAKSLATGLSETNREAANLRTSYKEAKANLGLKSAAQSLERANMVFDTAMRNQITRLQAMQSLGQGLGYAAGAYYGSSSTPSQQPGGAYSDRMVDSSYDRSFGARISNEGF